MNTPDTDFIRVILIEDHSDYRTSIRMLLSAHEKFDCTGSFSTMEDALAELREGLEADLILLDLGLPGMDGIEGIRCLRGAGVEATIVVLTSFTDRQRVFSALEAGAHGYLVKSASISRLSHVLEEILAGGTPLDPQIAGMILNTFQKLSPIVDSESLSPRECEVLELSARGLSRKEVASDLNLSIHSVTEYTRRIFEKLHVHSLPAAISAAIRRGLLDLS